MMMAMMTTVANDQLKTTEDASANAPAAITTEMASTLPSVACKSALEVPQ
jgi:hypothetical protein